MTRSSASPSARASSAAIALAALLMAAPTAAQEVAEPAARPPVGGQVLVVSRDVVLSQARVAQALNDAESALTDELQAEVDAVKSRLSAEEQELTRLRSSMPRDEFDRRVQLFDQTVREERRRTQRRAAALQQAFRKARSQLVEALIPILVAVSRERGASIVIDRAQILLAHPSIDVTEDVILLFDEQVEMPPIPTLADVEPPPEPEPDGEGEAGASD